MKSSLAEGFKQPTAPYIQQYGRGLREFKTPVSVIDGGWTHRPDRLESVEAIHLYTLNRRKRSFGTTATLSFVAGLLLSVLVYLS